MKKTIFQTLVAVLLLVGAGAQVQGAVIAFREGSNGYTGFKFATLGAGAAGTINGGNAAGVWTVDGGTASFGDATMKQGLLRWDNIFGSGASQIPYGSTINSATNSATYGDASDSTFAIHRMLFDWSSNTVTWNSMVGGVNTNDVEAVLTPTMSFVRPLNNTAGTVPANVWTNVLYPSGISNDLAVWAKGAPETPNSGWVVVPISAGTSGWGWTALGGTSAILRVDFTAPTVPVVTLTAPTHGTSISAPTTVSLTASATTPSGTVTGVGYYYTNSGSVTYVGTSPTGPTYPVTSASLAAGSYGFYAMMTNSGGQVTNSFTNVVTITNIPLSAVVTTPTNTQTYLTGEGYLVTATAAGSDLSDVLFYVDGALVGSDATAPYSFIASGLAAGSHTVYAAATNNLNAVGYSLTNVFIVTNAPAALSFNGVTGTTTNYVTMGNVAGKGDFNSLSNFTVEFWFKRTGPGAPDVAGAGTAGLGSSAGFGPGGGGAAIPLVTRGNSEAEGTTADANFYIGIVTNGGVAVLGADIEAYGAGTNGGGVAWAAGANHPVIGNIEITNNIWIHAAVTYDCTNGTWKTYINGNLDTIRTTNCAYLPRYDSVQHLGLGTAMSTTGARDGSFAGHLDEVRIWKTVRTPGEVGANKNVRIIAAPGLVARYGLDEGSGTMVFDSAGSAVAGRLTNSPIWTNALVLPVAGTDLMGTEQNTAQQITTEKMLDNDSDADFGTLSVAGVSAASTNGGTVSLVGGTNVLYTPVAGFAGADQFTYLLSDAQGGVVNGTVNVTVTAASVTAPNIVSYSQPVVNGPVTLVFAGIPGRTYEIQATTNVAPATAVNWITIWTTNAGTNGLFQYIDPWSPTPPSRFYRTYAP